MSERKNTGSEVTLGLDDLALGAQDIEAAIARGDFSGAADRVEQDVTGAWFSLGPARTLEILGLLASKLSDDRSILRLARGLQEPASSSQFSSPAFLAAVDFDNPREVFLLTALRMTEDRRNGRVSDALEQSQKIGTELRRRQPSLGSPDGWELHASVQIGITAMLAGDFTQALTSFTRAQMYAPVPKFAFLTRDALVKSALIHACFGNTTTAKSLLKRGEKVGRTSSWVEKHIDAHHDFTEALVSATDYDEALLKLESITFDDIGEMWPFYILAMHRILEAGGHRDELEYRLEMFDSMPFPRRDRDGFAGSVIPLKRVLLAMKAGREAETQSCLDRADPRFPYTQLIQAAANVYAGRTQQAIQEVTRLRPETRGFRLMEIRRLAILAAAQYQSNENADCINTLKRVAEVPRGLAQQEILLFSPETRELAMDHVPGWPTDHGGPSAFLTGLPKPGLALTDREIEIIRHLAEEITRAEVAAAMYISVNTLKTHLKSIYRKLGVSTAADAVLGAQRRGLL